MGPVNQPNSLLDIFFDRMPMGVALFDRNMVLQRCNPTWAIFVERYTSMTADEVVPGTFLFDLLPDTKDVLQPRFHQVLAGETVREETLHLRTRRTDTYWNVALSPLWDEGQVASVVAVVTDVTEHVRTYQGLERRGADRVRKLAALYDVLQAVGESLELQAMLAHSLERVLAAVRATVGAIYLLEESEEGGLQLMAYQGLSAEMAARLRRIPADSGLAGGVVQWQKPVVVPDIKRDPRTRPVIRDTDFQAYAGVTIRAGGDLLGVLSIFREGKRPFREEDVRLLDAVADQIGVAIENARLRQQAEQLAVVEERARLARELHDSVTQSLYSLSLFAAAAGRLARSDDARLLQDTLSQLSSTAQQALKEMRLLVYGLRPLALQQGGLVPALRQRLEAVERRAGIDATLVCDESIALSPLVEEELFHIAQEALNNALKHAEASVVTVSLQRDGDCLLLEVADNGRGFDISAVEDSGGLGLISMRQRSQRLGGELTTSSAPGAGTTVKVSVPVEAQKHE